MGTVSKAGNNFICVNLRYLRNLRALPLFLTQFFVN